MAEKETEKSLNFQFFTRNDQAVRERLRAHDYDWASCTGLGNLDILFAFLLEMDFFSLFDFRPEGRQRVMIPLIQQLSTYSAGVLCEMSSLNQIDMQLFKDRALLEKLGFTGIQIEEGYSRRSRKKHLPFNVSTLGKMLADLTLEEINDLFARQFALLAKKRFVPAGVYAVDSTDLEVSPNSQYQGIGKVLRDGKLVYGYKLFAVKYVGSLKERKNPAPGIIVAAALKPINHNDSRYLVPLLEQAQGNIGPNKVRMVVADRGFMGGENLWEVKHRLKMDFLIYSKSNMDVTAELKKRRVRASQELAGGKKPKDAWCRKDESGEFWGFNRLRWFWTYGDGAHQQQVAANLYKKNKPVKTNSVSGLLLADQRGKEITMLSSKRLSDSFQPQDGFRCYSMRQRIENAGFRELKQGYKINRFPSRKFNGVLAHVIITLLVYNFVSAYKTEVGGKIADLGLRRLHRDISYLGVIVYCAPYFGILQANELLELVGVPGKSKRAPPWVLRW
jgi:hypothetical protein